MFGSLSNAPSVPPSEPDRKVSSPVPELIEEQEEEEAGPMSEVDQFLLEESEKKFSLEESLNTPHRKIGRPFKGTGLTNEARAGIGITAALVGPVKAENLFDIAHSTASANKRGYNSPNEAAAEVNRNGDLMKKLERNRGIVIDKATAKMLKCLNLLDDEKLSGITKAVDISRVAVDMSRIVEKATPKQDSGDGSVHFHIYRPPQVEEGHYPTIDVTPEPSDVRE